MSPHSTPDCVLFDLDGTLADTAPDLAYALNEALRRYQRAPLPFDRIRPVVSHGGIALTRLGFGIEPGEAGFDERRRLLLEIYADNLCRETTLFAGMDAVLDALERRAIDWGIVTNKPAWLTDPLVAAMALQGRAGCVVSGDTCANRKPHPEPLLHACASIGCDPRQTWYVGDAGRTTVAALYGYLHPDDPPQSWQADLSIRHPTELLPFFETGLAAG
jgi:2-phosphoglycolate phosphatase